MNNVSKRSDCRLCHDTDLQLILQLNPSALANEFLADKTIQQQVYPLDLYQCKSCGHFQLLDIIDPEILFKNYLYSSGTSKLMQDHFKKYADNVIETYRLTENDLVIDIGSNDGTLLKYFTQKNIQVLGVEPAENLAIVADKNGIETVNDFFNQITAQQIKDNYQLASVITANNVFAHADNLDEIIEAVKVLLNGKGIFIFEVSYFKNVVDTNDFSQIYHEHLSYHTIEPLKKFLDKHDMCIIKVENINIHGGSIRVHAGYKDYWYCVEEFHDINYETPNLYKFIDFTNKIKTELKQNLLTLKSQGKTISAITASAKSTTFLHQCDLGTDVIDYIFDDAVDKIGKYSPGKKIPILPTSDIGIIKPDYLLILSFNFVDFIMEKFKDYKGQWIVPLEYKYNKN